MDVKKFRTIYLAILIPITVIICVVSVGQRVFKFVYRSLETVSQITYEDVPDSIKNLGNYIFNGNVNGINIIGNQATEETTYEGIEFENIEVDLNVANLEIVVGEEYKVELLYPLEIMPEVEVKNGNLSIENKDDNINVSYSNIDCEVTIYIPEGKKIETAKIDCDAGNIEIMTGTEFGELEINADAGNVEIYQINSEELTIRNGLGKIEIVGSELGKIYIETDLGDVLIDVSEFNEGYINTDMGEISVYSEFGSIKAFTSVGEIEVFTDSEDAKMELSTKLGSVDVNGETKGSSYNQ